MQISSGTPEHQISSLIRLPRMDERNISGNRGLEEVLPATEFHALLAVARDEDALAHTPRLVPDGDAARLDLRVRSRGRVYRGVASGIGVETRAERALGDEFDADLSLQIHRLEDLVPVHTRAAAARL